MKYITTALKFTIFFTILLGFMYPLLMTGISQVLYPVQANGNFVSRGGQLVGSILIGQNFSKPEYFWPRPSAVGYNPLPSGGSNQGQASQALKITVDERRAKLKLAHSDQTGEPPQDLLFASSSGLDPHITPEAAAYQMQRVAKARKLDSQDVQKLIAQNTAGRQFGIFGEITVNVLMLNLALDKMQGIETAPIIVPETKQ